MEPISFIERINGFIGHSESKYNDHLYRSWRFKRLHRFHTSNRYRKSDSCSNGYNTGRSLCGAIGNTHRFGSTDLHLDAIHQPEFNDRFIGNSESIFDYNIHGNRRRIRLHGNSTGNGNHQPDSGNNRLTEHYHLHRAEYNPHRQRSEHLYVEPVNGFEYNKRAERNRQSGNNDNLHSNGRCIGMHRDCPGNGYYFQPAGYQCFTGNDMCRTKHNPYSQRSQYIYLEPFSFIERFNRFIGHR